MIELFVGSTTKYAGKTMAVLGILDFWKNKGLKVGYFKPIGKNFTLKEDVKVEEDVLLIKERFSLEDDLSVMCPFYLAHQDYVNLVLGKLGDAEKKIYGAYEQLKKGKDAVLIGGGQDLFDGFSVGVSNISFVEKFNMPVLLVDAPVFGDINLDAITAMYDRLKDNMTGVILNRLLHRTFFVAKRVRTETGIGDHAVSISYAAVELGRKIFGSLDSKNVLLVGAGEMAELAVEHLIRNKAGKIYVANRTFENGVELARQFNGQPIRFEEITASLELVDIIISSTGSPDYVITRDQVKGVIRKRRNRPIFFIDIAVPRDIDPLVNRLTNS